MLAANRVFLAGAGKSGLAVRAFANRLMHLGLTVHVVGEITAPSVREGDLLVVNSASGETSSIVRMVQVASQERARVATLTMSPEATIGRLADVVIVVPGQGGRGPDGSTIDSVQPARLPLRRPVPAQLRRGRRRTQGRTASIGRTDALPPRQARVTSPLDNQPALRENDPHCETSPAASPSP